jgi:uncharacterized membrane protein
MITKSERPIIQLPPSGLRTAGDAICVVALLFAWFFLVSSLKSLPDECSIHFNLSGEANGWAAKQYLIFLPVVGTLIFTGLSAISHSPHTFNYKWPITIENAQRQYELAVNLISTLKLLEVILMSYLTWDIVEVNLGHRVTINAPLVLTIIVVLLAAVVVYFVKARKCR